MIYAIRAVARPGFRRAGIKFPAESWLLVSDPVDEILTEPRLICVSVDAPDFDRQIGPLPIDNPELLPEREDKLTPEQVSERLTVRLKEVEGELNAVRCSWASTLQNADHLHAELRSREDEVLDLKSQLGAVTIERDTAIRERDAARADHVTLTRTIGDMSVTKSGPAEAILGVETTEANPVVEPISITGGAPSVPNELPEIGEAPAPTSPKKRGQ